MGVVTLAVGTAAAGFSIAQTAKANKARRRQAAQQAARSKRQQIREARIKRAQIVSAGVAAGVPTSAEAGAVAGISAQLTANLSFLDEQLALQRKALSAESLAAISGGISSILGAAGAQLTAPQARAPQAAPTPAPAGKAQTNLTKILG